MWLKTFKTICYFVLSTFPPVCSPKSPLASSFNTHTHTNAHTCHHDKTEKLKLLTNFLSIPDSLCEKLLQQRATVKFCKQDNGILSKFIH